MNRAGSRLRATLAAAALAAIVGAIPVVGSAQDDPVPALSDPAAPAIKDEEPPADPNIAPPDADVVAPPEGGAKPDVGGPTQVDGMMAGITALPDLDLNILTATRDRPLFQPDRRPVVPPPPPPEDAPPPDDKVAVEMPFDYELKGIIGIGAGSIAILSQPGLATPLRSKTGDVLNGWTLTRIEPRELFFTGPGGEERRLSLFDDTGAWTTGDDGLQHLTIGPDAGAPAASDGGAPPEAPPDAQPDEGAKEAPQAEAPPPIDQPSQDVPPPEGEPKDVRKVY